jgi:hypothetical protein
MKFLTDFHLVRRAVAFYLAIILAAAAFEVHGEPTSQPSRHGENEVLNFSLLDYRGKCHELRRTDARFVVLFFTSPDCPIGRQSTPKLQAISEEFGGKGVAVWLINTMPQIDPTDAKLDAMYALGRYAPKKMLGDRYAVNGLRDLVPRSALGDTETLRRETLQYVWGPPPLPPVLRDEQQLVSRYFGVSRTCETVVIDTRSSTIVYRGAVDDQSSEGAIKPRAAHSYLRDALNNLVAGRAVAEPVTKVHGCAITYEAPGLHNITYAHDIAPIIQNKCVNCHSAGNIGPFAMSSYEKVKSRATMMHEVLLDRRMPPWHADPHFGKFSNDRSLTIIESQALTQWLAAGCPRGEGADPLAQASVAGPGELANEDAASAAREWPLGKPDYLVRIPRQEIPATGTVDYRYIDSDFVAPSDMWLRAAVTRPGAARVVHHIIVRMRQPDASSGPKSESYLFTTWVPGLVQSEVPPDTGLFVPKGAGFNFEIHYTTDGQPHSDESEVGLYLAKGPAKTLLEVRAAHTRELDIPAGENNAQHQALYFFKHDSIVYGLAPHMHVRGSWFKFELVEPDGHHETLLSVPNYDFNWQTSYHLATPRRVGAGSWMICTGGFDNSPQNPANPDPGKRVTWGLQTANEMFMGFIDLAELPPVAKGDAKSAGAGVTDVKSSTP